MKTERMSCGDLAVRVFYLVFCSCAVVGGLLQWLVIPNQYPLVGVAGLGAGLGGLMIIVFTWNKA